MNPRLRLAIDKANGQSRPTCQPTASSTTWTRPRATSKVRRWEEIRYEGYGIGGAAIIVDTMTDNRVRTVAEVRHAFSKYGGNLGTDGSVAFQFKHCGQIIFAPGTSEDKVMEVALEAGAEDVITDDDGAIEVLTAYPDFEAVKNALEAAGLQPEVAEVTMRAENTIELTGEDAAPHGRSCWTSLKTWTTCRRSSTTPRSTNEGPRDWRRWPRARAGVEAQAVPGRAAGVLWRPATPARRVTNNLSTWRSRTRLALREWGTGQ